MIQTAEEFLISKGLKGVGNLLVRDNSQYSENGTQKLMIEFAKLHVEAFRQNLLDNHLEIWDDCEVTTRECIENAYPLTNIK